MSPQFKRLRRDSKELKHYLFKVQKLGDKCLAHKIKSKLEYLNSQIGECESYCDI